MKKFIVCILVIVLSLVAFVACDDAENTTPTVGGEPLVGPNVDPNGNSNQTAREIYTDVDGRPIDDGDYMVADTLYRIDTGSRSVEIRKYASYADYKNNQYQLLYVGLPFSARVVKSPYSEMALYFEYNNKEYFITDQMSDHMETPKPIVYIVSGSSVTSSTMHKIADTIVEPQNGTYVTGKLEQTVNSVREEFYLFFVLTDTTASLYVSDNNTTYSGEPLYTITDYVEEFVSGYVRIRIPHANGQYYCSVTFKENAISLVNAYETKGDYSGSSSLTKIA